MFDVDLIVRYLFWYLGICSGIFLVFLVFFLFFLISFIYYYALTILQS